MLNEKKKSKMQGRLLKQLKDMPLANRLSERQLSQIEEIIQKNEPEDEGSSSTPETLKGIVDVQNPSSLLKQMIKQRNLKQLKQGRSSSLSQNQLSQDPKHQEFLQAQLVEMNKKYKKPRQKSIQYDQSQDFLEKHSSGTAGHGDYYAKQRYFLDEGDSNQVDALNIQIEDHRLKLLDEISQLVKGQSHDDNSSSDQSSQQRDKNEKSKPENQLTQKDALICTNLQNLNIDFDVNSILKLPRHEKSILKEKIVQFHDVIKR